jgi:hypothetical protein
VRSQPSVGEHRGGGLRVVGVAHHHVGAARDHLAHARGIGVEDLHLDAGDGCAHAAGLRRGAGLRDGEHRRRLGEPVALRERQPEASEHLRRLLRERRAARDQEAQPAAEAGVHRAEEHLADVDADLLAERAVERERGVEGRAGAGAEVLHLLDDAALEELPERRDAHHGGHLRVAQRLDHALAGELVEVDHRRAARERQQQPAGELEGVMQRQHREHPVALAERKHRSQRGDEPAEVAVREHHALGGSGRARGVDHARERVGRRGGDHRRRERGVLGGDVVEVHRGRGEVGEGAEALTHLVVADDHHGSRRAQHVGERSSLHRGVGGHGHGARAQDAEVRDGPRRVVARAEHHAVAGLHALGDEPRGGGLGARLPLQEGHPGEPFALHAQQRGAVLVALGGLVEHVEQRDVGPQRLRRAVEALRR